MENRQQEYEVKRATLLGLKDGVEQRFVISSKWSLNKVVSYRCSRPSTKLRVGIRCFTLCIIACSNINSYEGVIKKRWERPECLFLAEQNKNNARGTCNSRMQTQWLSHVQLTRNSMHIKKRRKFLILCWISCKNNNTKLTFRTPSDWTRNGGRYYDWRATRSLVGCQSIICIPQSDWWLFWNSKRVYFLSGKKIFKQKEWKQHKIAISHAELSFVAVSLDLC